MEAITVKRVVLAILCLLLPLALLALPRSRREPVPTIQSPTMVPSVTKPRGSRNPWTLAEARAALKRQPDDGYLQYVVLQLASQEDRLAAVRDDIPLFATRHAAASADPFDLFISTRTVQQRLQLSTVFLPAAGPGNEPSQPAVRLRDLQAPTVPGRDWKQLLGEKAPAVSPLSRWAPADFYLAEFRTLDRLARALDGSRSWLQFLQVQCVQDATARPVRRRLQQQLVFDVEDRALPPLVEQVAVTGSDPFLGEGSDVTLLIQLRAEAMDAFRSRTERALSAAEAQPGAGRSAEKYLDIDYTYVGTADRRINAYAITLPQQRLHIRSNSRAALGRVLDAVRGKATPLGATDEYRYLRTQMPAGANEEDGLIYFPHAFIERLIRPALHIAEARRLVGYNHLCMIANAAQLYRTQRGLAPTSLDDLTRAGYTPGPFNQGALSSPVGGTYALAPDGITGVCSVLGTADNLTPCIDLPTSRVTVAEAKGYREFARKIDAAGRLWLAPVALRLQLAAHSIRAEALVLAPADNPMRLTRLLGAEPEALEPLPVARRSMASLTLRIDKERWMAEHLAGVAPRRRAAVAQAGMALASAMPAASVARIPWAALGASDIGASGHASLAHLEDLGIEPAQLRGFLQTGLGNQAALHLCDPATMVDVSLATVVSDLLGSMRRGEGGIEDILGSLYRLGVSTGTLASPAYVAIPVADPNVVDAFLGRLDDGLARMAPTWRGKWFGTSLQAEFYHLTTKSGPPTRALGVRAGPVRYHVFWARIGDGLYIANQPALLDDLRTAARTRTAVAGSDRGPVAHAMLKLRPGHATQALPAMRLGWEEANREACQRNVAMLSAAARAFSFTPPVTNLALDQESRQRLVRQYAAQLYRCDCACPDGGRYLLSEDGRSFSCTVHGSATQPQQPERPMVGERLGDMSATLTLTRDGVRVVVILPLGGQ
jgi:hypothetical protein